MDSRKFLAFLAVFLLCADSALAVVQTYDSASFKTTTDQIAVRTLKYEPYPAEPGRYFDLWLTIENTGQASPYVKFTLLPEYPFVLDSNEAAAREVGILGGRQSKLLHYVIRLDNKAVEGTSALKYQVDIDGRKSSSSVDISIQTKVPILAVLESKTEPAEIAPGEKSNVSILLENQGESPLRNIVASLFLYTKETTTTSIATLEMPFTTYGTGNEKQIPVLNPHEKKEISFEIVADPDAVSKPYKLPLDITYSDNIGNDLFKQEIIGVVVGSAPDIDVLLEKTGLSKSQKIGSITLKVVNRGVTDVKFASVELLENKSYKILSSNREYIGAIDSDDFQTTEFRLELKKTKDLLLPVKLTYADFNNRQYEEDRNVQLKVLTDRQITGKKSKTGTILVVVILLAAAAFFLYKRWEKKKLKRTK